MNINYIYIKAVFYDLYQFIFKIINNVQNSELYSMT